MVGRRRQSRLMDEGRLARGLQAIDAANADDPHRLLVGGVERPKEQVHAEMVSAWIERLVPDAGEALRLAARAHHLRRWTIPRSSYPSGRAGYLRWRRALHEQHARETGAILESVGYDEATIERVGDIVRKRGLGRDAEVQALEDALCLVFIETQLTELAQRVEDDKMIDIIRKTRAKMSDRAVELALALPLGSGARDLVERALSP